MSQSDEVYVAERMKRPSSEASVELTSLLSSPPTYSRLSGSGENQAPLIVELLNSAGLRAAHQPSPPGVAVYLRPPLSSPLADLEPKHALLWLMCGLAPDQPLIEHEYADFIRIPLLGRLLATRLRQLRPHADLDAALAPLESSPPPLDEDQLEDCVRRVITAASKAIDVAELRIEREWSTLLATHSSLANACLHRFLEATGIHLQDATLITSNDPERVRISLLLYDQTLHEAQQRPRKFIWVPSLADLIANPSASTLSTQMVVALWDELMNGMYRPSTILTNALTEPLTSWFTSCITRHGGLGLRATFQPQQQLCLYLHGVAGAGKSSFARALLPAIVTIVRRFLHPECSGAFVKQALNKSLPHLNLEFERRPNNNDLSVVGVIEMAREPLSAMEPRLMMLALEEMPEAKTKK